MSRHSSSLSATDRFVAKKVNAYQRIHVPRDQYPKVFKWVRYFSVQDKARFQRHLDRGETFRTLIQEQLVRRGIPKEFYYVGVVESGYVLNSVSHAGAVGPWQFMRPTAKEYGLKINKYLDERKAPIRASQAAASYFRWLHRRTKSWELALAAYNAGPGRVSGAIRRGGSDDYWQLVRNRVLPRDTREYVAQFMAAMIIGQNLKYFGFRNARRADVARAVVPRWTSFTELSRLTGVPEKRLKKWNPHLRKGIAPPFSMTSTIWVDRAVVSKIQNSRARLGKRAYLKPKKLRSAPKKQFLVHRVQKGQTLLRVARLYSNSVNQIKRLNNLKGTQIYVGQRLKVLAR